MIIAFFPNKLIKKIVKNDIITHEVNILLSSLLTIIIFIVYNERILSTLNTIPHFCLFKKITKINCPFCGTTRALNALGKLDIINAIEFNSMIIILFLFIIIQIVLRITTILNNELIYSINILSYKMNRILLLLFIFNWLIITLNQ